MRPYFQAAHITGDHKFMRASNLDEKLQQHVTKAALKVPPHFAVLNYRLALRATIAVPRQKYAAPGTTILSASGVERRLQFKLTADIPLLHVMGELAVRLRDLRFNNHQGLLHKDGLDHEKYLPTTFTLRA